MSTGIVHELQQADYLNYGFVALHASDAIQFAIEGRPLTARHLDSLATAETLLDTVASGFDLVTHGHAHGHDIDPVGSVGALGIAIAPLERLQQTLTSPGAVVLIRQLAAALHACRASTEPPTPEQRHKLNAAKLFFDEMYAGIARDIDQNPVFGGPDELRDGWLASS